MQRTIQEYERHMEQTAATIIQVTDRVGLIMAVPLPYELDPRRFMDIGERAMASAAKRKIEHLVIDFSNMESLRSPQNILGFVGITQGFRLIGIEVILTGITPLVAKSVVDSGMNLGGIRIFGNLSDALKGIYGN